MLRIGLTGGIGAGKSEVARRLVSHGAVLIDADKLAREVVAPDTPGLREVVARFGAGVLDDTGALDRPALAAAVFDDESARRDLEAIIHPRVRTRTAGLTAAAPPDAIVVNDVPLLVEVGLAATYHLVIVVEAEPAIRVDRLVRDRGMTEQQAWSRIRSQAEDRARQAAADVLLRNDQTREALHAAVDALWRDRLRGFEANLRAREPARSGGAAEVVAYDPTWPAQFDRLAARVGHATGGLRIDHVGPTAVTGLPAVDVIEMQLTVDDLAAADAIADRLAEAGFPRAPGARKDDARSHGSADPGRPARLRVRPAGSPGWRSSLLLRDWLRADPAGRQWYAEATRRAAGPADPADGAAVGQAWRDRALERAGRWAEQTGWQA